MATLVQVPTAVHAYSNTVTKLVQVGAAGIVPGNWLYQDANGNYQTGENNQGATEAAVEGMALGYGPEIGNSVLMATGGDVDVGVTHTVGAEVSLDTGGGMADSADVMTGEFNTVLGTFTPDGDTFRINIQKTGVAKG